VSTTCSITTTPLLAVTQNCPVAPTIAGTLLTYSGTVRNAGNINLTNVVVLNNQSGATPVFTADTLAPGATANFHRQLSGPDQLLVHQHLDRPPPRASAGSVLPMRRARPARLSRSQALASP